MEHYSVLLKEAIEGLNIRPDGIYVDGTLGRGGHSSEILKRLTTGHLYSFDIDDEAFAYSEKRLSEISDSFTLIKANFADMKSELNQRNMTGVDGILLDIGVSSPQFDEDYRGFSYRYEDSRLDMRMDRNQSLDAYKVVNEYEYGDLVRIFYRYGEESYAKQIARKIETERAKAPIETTGQLVEIIRSALPRKVVNKHKHPAKKVFQAIRIEVNNELENLSEGLKNALDLLNPCGRLAVISFHSLEDQIIKSTFKNASQPPHIDKRIPLKQDEIREAEFTLITRKPITAGERELNENRRSHSAKLRIIEKRG